jgi:PPOX class probable F420-dependent enzyme
MTMISLPDPAKRLLDTKTFVVLSTLNPDGSPQSSVIWAKRDGDELVFSTIHGRRKTLNMQRDPRVSACFYDPADPYLYVEIRGTVSMDEAGGDELIDELSRVYAGRVWTPRSEERRLVCRLRATKVLVR